MISLKNFILGVLASSFKYFSHGSFFEKFVAGVMTNLPLTNDNSVRNTANKEYLVEYQHATTEGKKKKVPGSGYIEKILKFSEEHYKAGELFMEYVKHACSKEQPSRCEYCSTREWTGPPAERVTQPMPDRGNPGHYLPVFKTPLVDKAGQPRAVGDWQPRAFITSMHKEGNISLDDKEVVKANADKRAVTEELVVACIEYLRDLSVNKARRDNEKTKKKEEKRNAKNKDYNWLELVISGKLNGLLVLEPDKYLTKYKLNTNCSKVDKVRAITADVLRKESSGKQRKAMASVSAKSAELMTDELDGRTDSEWSEDDDVDSDDEESDDDVVLNDFDDDSEEHGGLIVTTRSGRTAGSWRLAFTD